MEASLIAFNASSIAQNDRDFASRQVLAAESSSCQTSWEKSQTRRAERCWVHYAEETRTWSFRDSGRWEKLLDKAQPV
jgi:hypothetical protein